MNISMSDLYVSRTDRDAAIIARQDPVVYEEGAFADALAPEQLEAYRKDGVLLLPNLFSEDEIATLNNELERLCTDPSIASREEAIREPDSDEIRSVFAVHKLSRKLEQLARDPRLIHVARQILGSEVYIHQSRANMKPGFDGKEFYWHSDFETWHVEDGMPAMRALSCSVLLTDNVASNGPLMVIPGSHYQFIACQGETPDKHYEKSLKKQEFGVPDKLSLEFLADQGGIRQMTGKAGSVVFFDCNLMHGSASNLTPWPRSNVFMVYNSIENTLHSPKYDLEPRPEYIATREEFKVLKPLDETALAY